MPLNYYHSVNIHSIFRHSPSLKVEDYEPGFALRKIALLYEKNDNAEVASLIQNLSLSTLNSIYQQFPLDMFVDGLPQTLSILNALYTRIYMQVSNLYSLKETMYCFSFHFIYIFYPSFALWTHIHW